MSKPAYETFASSDNEMTPKSETNSLKRARRGSLKSLPLLFDNGDADNLDGEDTSLLRSSCSVDPHKRTGDVITATQAVLTLSKGMISAGMLSLPYAWKMGGLWVSFVGHFLVSLITWYGYHVMARTAQYVTPIAKVTSLDYGHFAKATLEHCGFPSLRRHGNAAYNIVSATVVFYQIGVCTVLIVFTATNMQKVMYDVFGVYYSVEFFATVTFLLVLLTNMITALRVLSMFAAFAFCCLVVGTAIILGYCWTLPNQWRTLPAATDFQSTIIFIGMVQYAFEGDAMILPIENKLEHPVEFLHYFGVLPTTISICTIFLAFLSFYGYTVFGAGVYDTITLNLPDEPFFTGVGACLTIQAMLSHCLVMYVVINMFTPWFRRTVVQKFEFTRNHPVILDKLHRTAWVFVTYVLAIAIPQLDILIPFVGVIGSTLCALIYPMLLELVTFWYVWKTNLTKWGFRRRVGLNFFILFLSCLLLVAGIYANVSTILSGTADDDDWNPYHYLRLEPNPRVKFINETLRRNKLP